MSDHFSLVSELTMQSIQLNNMQGTINRTRRYNAHDQHMQLELDRLQAEVDKKFEEVEDQLHYIPMSN